MRILPFLYPDLVILDELRPDGWPDIRPDHEFYLRSSFCTPLKAVVGKNTVGIGTVIRHEDTAWLAQIIVHPDYRNRGIGNEITKALIENINAVVFRTVYLDATELGFPVYSKNGFEVEAGYAHFKLEKGELNFPRSSFIIPFEKKYANDTLSLDRIVSGENREQILNGYLEASLLFVRDGILQGVYFPSLANGLIIANDTDAGIELMKERLNTKPFAIVPVNNKPAVDFLRQQGLQQLRVSRRMRKGIKREWRPDLLFNRISGALG